MKRPLIGKKSEDLIGHSLIASFRRRSEALEHHLANFPVQPCSLEHRVVMPSGQIRWVQWTNRAIFDDEGSDGVSGCGPRH
jgi:PAS domain-containing protein